MTWTGLMTTTTTAASAPRGPTIPQRPPPFAHRPPSFSPRVPYFPARVMNRGQDFSYSATGWSTAGGEDWSGGKPASKGATNAAVSALALLSFLFFLNMLQQQLALGQQQTLLFQTNTSGGNFTRINRRVRRPFVTLAAIKAKQGVNGRTRLTIEATKNAKIKIRRTRDAKGGEEAGENDLHRKEPRHPMSIEDMENQMLVEDEEEDLPIMMAGLPDASSLQLSAWLQGKLNADELRTDLVDTLTNCRAAIACSMHKKAMQTDPKALPEDSIKRILSEAGEFVEPGLMDEACEALLKAAEADCTLLAKSFTNLLPDG